MNESQCLSRNDLVNYLSDCLSASDRQAVEAHISTCAACRDLLTRLSSAREDQPAISGLDVTAAFDNPPANKPPANNTSQIGDTVPGYELLAPIGEGGMGVVYAARDVSLDREVAVKLISARYVGDPRIVARFNAEAKITGQLEHPGVPAVHELGVLNSGRPFLAMKLVRGETLAKRLPSRIEELSEQRGELLGIFERICQAVGYAHSKQIVHRDLKPGNIMVSAFGEVQVLDWGLAKAMKSGSSEKTVVAEQTDTVVTWETDEESGHLTRAGSVLGTPAYMAPEQARGEIETLDARADVFGLGGILCQMLTGKPTFAAMSGAENHRLALAGDLSETFARLDSCGADADLISLAKSCLAANKDQRPEDGGAVAQSVAAYRDKIQDRLRQAEIERAKAQTKAEGERKRRTLAVGLTAMAMLLLFAAGLGGWQYWNRQQDRQTNTFANIERAYAFTDDYRFDDANGQLRQARIWADESRGEELRRAVDLAESDSTLVQVLDQIRLDRSSRIDGKVFNLDAAAQRYAAEFKKAGLGEILTDEPAVVADRIRQRRVQKQVIAALDDWAGCVAMFDVWASAAGTDREVRLRWLLAVVKLADPHPVRDKLRDIDLWCAPYLLRKEIAKANSSDLTTHLADVLARVAGWTSPEGLSLLRRVREEYPRDFWANFTLATACSEAQQNQESLGYYLVALAIRPNTVPVHNNLSTAYADLNDLDKAAEHSELALKIDPNYAFSHNNLGKVYAEKGDVDKAIQLFFKALLINPEVGAIHRNLGTAYSRKGDTDKAIEHYQRAVELNDLPAHTGLAGAYFAKGDLDKALEHYQAAITFDPNDAKAHTGLGSVYYHKKNLNKALEHHLISLKLDPNFPPTHFNIAVAYSGKGDLNMAIEHYLKAIDINPQLHDAHYNVAVTYRHKKDDDKALEHYRRVIEINPRFHHAFNDIGTIYVDRKELDKAIEYFRKAVEIDASYLPANQNLGHVYYLQGEYEKAIEHLKKSIETDPKNADILGMLGTCLMRVEKFTEARDSLKQCLKVMPLLSLNRLQAGRELQSCERLIKLDEQLETGETPERVEDALQLAEFCLQIKKRYKRSAELFQQAYEAEPKLKDHSWYNAACAALCAAAGQGKDANDLSDEQQLALRKQAQHWLQADLTVLVKDADSKPNSHDAIRQILQHWQQDVDLDTIRAPGALEKLPEAEHQQWQDLWAEVTTVLDKVAEKTP